MRRCFVVEVVVEGHEPGPAAAGNKREAERLAAAALLLERRWNGHA